jgi:predicted signal transduction protein with EAL and GGDEF domain
MSASVGLVGMGAPHEIFDEVSWMESADQALFMAKEAGRGQATVYACEP